MNINKIKKNTALDSYFSGSKYKSLVDKIFALIIILLPILQHYKGPLINMSFTLLVLIIPLLFLRAVFNIRKKNNNLRSMIYILPMMLFFIYTMFVHFNLYDIVYGLLMLMIFFIIFSGSLNVKYCIKYALYVCLIASFIIILQSLSFYFFKVHIKIIPTSLLLNNSDRWLDRAIKGLTWYGGLYRPSGIFLEPSHFTLYSFPLLSLLILLPKLTEKKFIYALIISIGLFLSTSGIGIIIALFFWGSYFIFYRKVNSSKDSKIIIIKRLIIFLSIVLILLIVGYTLIPQTKAVLKRIFDFETMRSSAIEGRVKGANELIKRMQGLELIFGAGSRSISVEFNLSGFHSTILKWGIIGLIFNYMFYILGIFKLKKAYLFINIIIIVLSFFSAHTHGTFYLTYYALFLYNGYYSNSRKG